MSTDFPNFVSFCKPPGAYSPTTATYYEAMLRNLSPEAIEAANANPMEYIFAYARILTLKISSQMKYLGVRIEQEEGDTGTVEDMSAIWEGLKHLREGLTVSISSLRRHSSPSLTYSELLRDYEQLLNDVKQSEIDYKDVLNHKVSLLALKESKESIRQTEIVSRLSQLAFVFIPLTFVTSCFGMNLSALGSGNGEIWIFCVISVALTVTILLISIYSWKVAHRCSRFLENNTHPARVLFRLAKYLPAETMWMVLFMLSQPSKIGRYLGDMGLYYHFLPNGTEDYFDHPVYQPSSDLELNDFWKTKGERIHSFIHTAGWTRNTFRRRLMRQ
ncbi:hypothetical protein MMC29_008137 [Sticta canariensis]|nr:hypothetical protein [Sticta canariensis]